MVKVLPSPRTDTESEKERSQGDEKSSADWWLMLFTGALVLVGGVQVGVFGLQSRRLRQTVEQMKITEERQLRAYVQAAISPNSINLITAGQIASLPISIKNSGQTPAYDVELEGRIIPYDYPLLGNLPDFPKSTDAVRVVINPGQELPTTLRADNEWTKDEIHLFKCRESIRLYAYGRITYRDAFDKIRHTSFRLMEAEKGVDRVRFTYCYQGNEAE